MGEDFKTYSLIIFKKKIHFHKEKLCQLSVEALQILDVLRRSSIDREEIEKLKEFAMKAAGLVEQEIFTKLKQIRRWNRGCCKE